MNHYAIVLEYLGKNYFGWQKQKNRISVQETVEKALSKIANHKVSIVCAGRTDSGVHATAQVISFSTHSIRSIRCWLLGTNTYLPKEIRIVDVYRVNRFFNARFSANYRVYNYLIYQGRYENIIAYQYSLQIRRKLDLESMNESCQFLLGEKDFSSFRSSKCQSKSSFRQVQSAHFKSYGDFIIFEIKANAFLYHMVLNIMGAFLEIGLCKKNILWFKEFLLNKKRDRAPRAAPENGLYLVEVGYKDYPFIKSKRSLKNYFYFS